MFENPRRGRQARNLTKNVPKILDLKSSSEQIFSENWRWVPLNSCGLLKPILEVNYVIASRFQFWWNFQVYNGAHHVLFAILLALIARLILYVLRSIFLFSQQQLAIPNSYDNISYVLYTYTYSYYWLKNTLIMTYKNCCSHAISHLVLGVT